jgi:hypothetical protein
MNRQRLVILFVLVALACVSPQLDRPDRREVLRLHRDLCIGTFGCGSYRLRPGEYEKQGEDESSEYFAPGSSPGHGDIVSGPADPWKAIRAYKDRSRICVVTVFNVQGCRRWRDAERITLPNDPERRTEPVETSSR